MGDFPFQIVILHRNDIDLLLGQETLDDIFQLAGDPFAGDAGDNDFIARQHARVVARFHLIRSFGALNNRLHRQLVLDFGRNIQRHGRADVVDNQQLTMQMELNLFVNLF